MSEAEKLVESIKDNLPAAWLGGRQRRVLIEVIAAKLAERDLEITTLKEDLGGWKNAAQIAKELADMGESQLAQLRAENERLTKQVRECPTCDGSGAMDVVVRVLPPDSREVYETEQCAECRGTGVSSWGQAIDEANELRAVLDEKNLSVQLLDLKNLELRAENERLNPQRCPKCESPSPRLHPAVQHEGEVQECNHFFHAVADRERLQGENEKLKTERDAATVKALERAKEIIRKYRFTIGVLHYPCTDLVDAIQASIDAEKVQGKHG